MLDNSKTSWVSLTGLVLLTAILILRLPAKEIYYSNLLVEQKRSYEAVVTGYNSLKNQTDSTPCIAAYGHNICKLWKEKGVRACAANWLPKGTELKIGDIKCVVLDKMNKRFSDRVDIWFETLAESKKWGVKKIEVLVLN